MTTRANYSKIGLFVVLGFSAALALAVGLGATRSQRTTVPFFTYFNESVQGLDVGAPVTFRGVGIGRVGEITIAPDRRLVAVRMDVDVQSTEQLGLVPRGEFARTHVFPEPPSDLRVQLGSQGLTGTKHVEVDFFDPKANPPPVLSFPPMPHYIAAATSLTKSLEDLVSKAMERLDTLAERATVVVDGVGRVVDDLERGGGGKNMALALGQAKDTLLGLNRIVGTLHRDKIAESAGATLAALRVTADDLSKVLLRLDGERGLVATTQRAVSSFDEVGHGVVGATRDLDETLSDIREAAAAFRELTDELEREPDALLKGRSQRASQ